MSEYMLVPKEDHIAHHGIDGQKWGVKNGPPYPLKKGIKKVKRAVRKAKKYQRENRPTPQQIHKMSDKEIMERTTRLKAEADLYQLSKYGQSDVEKILRDGAKKGATIVVAGSVAALGAYVIAKKTGMDITAPEVGRKIWSLASFGKK